MSDPAQSNANARAAPWESGSVSGGPSPSRRAVVARAAVLVAIVLAAAIPTLGRWCSLSPDSFAYLDTARTLVETGRYPDHHLIRPPGFPTLIAPLLTLGDLPALPLRTLFMLSWAVTSVLTYLLYRRELGELPAWLAGLLVATSAVLLKQTTVVLSEPIYLPLSIGTLLVLNRWWRRPPVKAYTVALAGILAAATLLTRSAGTVLAILLLAAVIRPNARAGQLRQRIAISVLFAAFAFGPYLLWQWRQHAYAAGSDYYRQWTIAREAEDTDATGLALQIERFCKFGPLQLDAIKAATVPQHIAWRVFNPPFDSVTSWLVGGFFILAAIVRLLRARSPADAYVLLTLGMLAFWPWNEGVRLVTPLMPLFSGYLIWVGLAWWRRPGRWRFERPLLAACLLLLLLAQVGELRLTQVRADLDRDKAARRLDAMHRLAEWLDRNTPPQTRWTGISEDGHPAKTSLLGAAYFSRRPVRTLDVRDTDAYEAPTSDDRWVFLQDAITRRPLTARGYAPAATLDGFTILMKQPPKSSPSP
ncbi:MAG: glycosyltransferase family 39 protein [Planctomycetota bacterium]